jgi:hypothetical protein
VNAHNPSMASNVASATLRHLLRRLTRVVGNETVSARDVRDAPIQPRMPWRDIAALHVETAPPASDFATLAGFGVDVAMIVWRTAKAAIVPSFM